MTTRRFLGSLLAMVLGAGGCGGDGATGGSTGSTGGPDCKTEGSCPCGDGVVSAGETCDDGATLDGDACSPTCQEQRVLQAALGFGHTCALLSGGKVKCWGRSTWVTEFGGPLGLGDKENRGDMPGEMGSALPAVDLGTGAKAIALSGGYWHTCALLEGGSVKCWGYNKAGQLGLGDAPQNRGDEPGEMGDALPAVDLGTGVKATAIAAGWLHTCAILEGGSVKCWGANSNGQCGDNDGILHGAYPGTMGDALPAINLGTGKKAIAITAGDLHTCALLEGGTVKCWGSNRNGQLGLGDTQDRGDNPGEMGDALPAVDFGSGKIATAVATRSAIEGDTGISTCALLSDGSVKCWGYNAGGQLGLGDTQHRGDAPGEMGDALPAVDLGSGKKAIAIDGGALKNCALLEGGTVKCWGGNSGYLVLGLGDRENRGDDPGEMGDALPEIDLGKGKKAIGIAGSSLHACAWFDDGSLKCWGFNSGGQLGLGDVGLGRGDEPGEMGDALPAVKLFSDLW